MQYQLYSIVRYSQYCERTLLSHMFQRSNMEKRGAALKPGSLQEEDLAVEEQKMLAESQRSG